MDILYDIIGYEGLYKINKNGDVWSCKSNIFLKPWLNSNGYLMVGLGKKKKYRVHRLLALQYIPNPDNYPIIDHIDQNRTNNNLDNLRWTSNSKNQQNKTKHKNNTTGFKHIDTTKKTFRSGNIGENWRIQINIENFKCRVEYSKNKYTLEEVVEFRNKIYIENNIQKYD